ncbi:phospholipase D family protein [Algoriphagus marinus]|uniref:phospholipase D family protein n=1 Tax=Algoriphagus marinus TaxID=1925762 RepID=UPI00094B7FDF|nr:phospholipase D family protein [Algoriphagus marinus]
MAKFLDTTGVSYHLQQLINNANERLILISPYLKINERIKQSLEDKNRLKIDIRVVYGKNELQPEENNWLKSQTNIRSCFCKDLHAKCYLNENEAIITSMNLYEFSQVNNNEMGIYIVKETDPTLYNEIYEEVKRLIRISDDIIVTVEKAPTKDNDQETVVSEPLKKIQKYFSATALSKELGVSSKDLQQKLEKLDWIEKKNDEWILTSLGKNKGGQMKKGQYGDYIAYPDSVIAELN